jgi:hypothetical protein
MANKQALLDVLRSFSDTVFKGRNGYVLDGDKGKRRYHRDDHHAQHDPRRFPPKMYSPSALRPVGIKPDGILEGYEAEDAHGMRHFVKTDDPEVGGDAANELAAYTVLGSLGFRVPHVSVVDTYRPTIASKSLHHNGQPLRPHYGLSPTSIAGRPTADTLNWQEAQDELKWPHDHRDVIDQRLAPILALDGDRNAANVMYDKGSRRWDLDFGTGEASRWLEGMDVFDAEVLRNRLHTQLISNDVHPSLLAGIQRLADPKTESDFNWLKTADQKPFNHLGFDHPHQGMMESLRVIRPDLKMLTDAHSGKLRN